ncbi:MAG: M23 family metallopeptidase [Bacilli bacterium]
MTIEEYKKNKCIKTNNYFKNLLSRFLLTLIIFMSLFILINNNKLAQKYINKYLFETNFKFSEVTKIYNKLFADINKINTKKVNSTLGLTYTSLNPYLNGVKLSVEKDYPVNLLNSGIVVFIGEKEGYGHTIIVQQSDGIDTWYSGLQNTNIKMYEYLNKGSIIGSARGEFTMTFAKDGEFLNYKEILK